MATIYAKSRVILTFISGCVLLLRLLWSRLLLRLLGSRRLGLSIVSRLAVLAARSVIVAALTFRSWALTVVVAVVTVIVASRLLTVLALRLLTILCLWLSVLALWLLSVFRLWLGIALCCRLLSVLVGRTDRKSVV